MVGEVDRAEGGGAGGAIEAGDEEPATVVGGVDGLVEAQVEVAMAEGVFRLAEGGEAHDGAAGPAGDDGLVFLGGEGEDGAVAELEGKLETLGGLEVAAGEVGGGPGLVALALGIVVEDEAPDGGFAGAGGLELVDRRAFVADEFAEGEAGDVGPGAGEARGGLHGDRLVGLVLGEAVVGGAVVDDGGVDDVVGFLNVDEGLAEGDEVRGAGGPDALFAEAVAAGGGGPEDEVVAVFLVVNGFGGPGAAGVVGGDFDEARFGPVHEVGGFPDHDGAAAGAHGAADAPVAVPTEVGGDEEELLAVVGAEQVGVAHALLADFGDEHGVAVVERGPLAAVVAGREVDLLGERGLFTLEGDEEVAGRSGENRSGKDRQAQEDSDYLGQTHGDDRGAEGVSRRGRGMNYSWREKVAAPRSALVETGPTDKPPEGSALR